ncbi:MAG: GGDEF and EAL domain-containing protein [Betaproteobacteria bacterium]|nr:GGDEF and EAL domain-containing protein [Betaproteobacteria bacterium]
MAYTAPVFPADENERLAELAAIDVLDTAAEEAFDSLTRLAAYICGTPISLVTLVDAKRQWFKARIGLNATETPRDISFCGHAIADPDRLFIVTDASKDERFRDNPLVTGDPNIRFYAGMPLKTGGGSAVGTLCVIDRVPRELTPTQRDALVTLSHAVVAQLKLRRRLSRHEQYYAMLAHVSAMIARVTDIESLCSEACRAGVELGSLKLAWIGLVDSLSGNLRPMAWAASESQLAESAFPDVAGDPFERAFASEVIATKRPRVCNGLAIDPHTHANSLRQRHSLLASVVLPLVVNNTVWGVMSLYAGRRNFFDAFYLDRAAELANDISFGIDRLQKARDIHYLSFYDAVTGLPNKAGFEDKFETLAPQLHGGCLLAVGMEQLDKVGAAYGAGAIDSVLKQVTQRLQAHAPDRAIVALVRRRLFALFVPDEDPANFSRFATQRLAKALAVPYSTGDEEVGCAVHLGASFFPDDGKTIGALLTAAERAAQSARNLNQTFRFYNAKIDEMTAARLRLEGDLRKAISRGGLVNYYQPKVDLITGRIVGAEALMRWLHPERGLVSPAEFIPVLEASGLILEAGRQALARAIGDFCKWRDAQLDPPRIAVNVTATQLKDGNFMTAIQHELAAGKCNPLMLSIELTESSLMTAERQARGVLQELREIGILIAIDDFGTGYSSLAYLVTLPMDELKIDRAFIMKMTVEPAYMGLVNTIISLAHNLNLKVVAEGVETDEQANLLRLLRCDQAQGYRYGKPVPAADFAGMLASSH